MLEQEFAKLVEGIIDTIAKDADHEILESRVTMLNSIPQCVRADGEKYSSFAARFNSKVSIYINAHKTLSVDEEETFELLLISNARLNSSDLNSLNLHLHYTTKPSSAPHGSFLFAATPHTRRDTVRIIRNTISYSFGRVKNLSLCVVQGLVVSAFRGLMPCR